MADRPPTTGGLRIHAVVRAGWGRAPPEGWRLVEEGPVSAAVRPAAGESPGPRAHGRRVEALMREVPLAPVPPGLAARDETSVRRFLQRARLPLLEALALTEGCWELRVHLVRRRGGTAGSAGDLPAGVGVLDQVLRRRSRAIRALAPGPGVAFSRACLVPRSRWIAFVEEVARHEEGLAGLEADVTGPWAAWDFVRLFGEGRKEEP